MKAKLKQLAAVAAVSAMTTTAAYAGPLAEAFTSQVGDVKSDLYTVGGVVVGLAIIRVIFALGIRLFNRAG